MLRNDFNLVRSEEKQNDTFATAPKNLAEEIQYKTTAFNNWGGTVKTHPDFTFYPKTKYDICRIVKWAKSEGKNVRVSAYKHSWTNLYAQNHDILVSLLDFAQSELIPAIHKKLDNNTPFQKIELVGNSFQEEGKTKHLCKIGAATTNEQFRNWAVTNFTLNGNLYSWTVPCNVILVENTFGGTNAMLCHGAGAESQTLSDLVTEIEFVNPNGELQTIGYKVTDPVENQAEGRKLIKTAAGSFGQLGVVTELTLKLDQMTHARMNTCKPRVALAVPPPDGFVFPAFLPTEIMKGIKPKDLRLAKQNFIERCESDYYSEWFWFSLHNQCYINSWKNDGNENDSQSRPSPLEIKIQEVEEYLAFLANSTILRLLPAEWQTLLLSDAAMLSLPANQEMVVPLTDALHFRRGIHNMPVQDMEFEIPIPMLPDGKPDWSICQKAWWDAIVIVYEWQTKKNKIPMRLPLEMRIMGGSDMTMAAQKGNKYTCSIEVLTLSPDLINKKEWLGFMQAILDKWSTYTDAQGNPLNIRPHWAKQWKGLTIQRAGEQRKEIIEYLKEVYQDDILVFNRDLESIAEKGGYAANDLKLFSTPLLDQIFHDTPVEMQAEELPDLDIFPSVNNESLLENAQTIHTLILKAQRAHKGKEKFLAAQHNTPLERIKGIIDFEEIGAVLENPAESLLAVNTWFKKGRLQAEANERLLEDKFFQNEINVSSCCMIM